jgi:hypothetical protein
MPYIGQQPTNVAFLTDQFSGNGSTTAFTLSAAPANTSSILVAISGVLQDPSTYSVSGTTLTFSPAPPTGTGNISVRFLGIPASGVTTTAYRTVTEFTATAGQTTFSVPSYTVGFIDVYRNGVMLGSADYTATSGLSVVLVNGCTVGDLVEVISFQVSSVLNAIPATAGSVGTTFLADNSVTTAKIANSNVTMAKLDSTAQYTGFKNRLINGDMGIAQRGTSFPSISNSASAFPADRFRVFNQDTTSVYSAAQLTDAPAGFVNSVRVQVATVNATPNGESFIEQIIEANNCEGLAYGSASAQPITLSFWVKTSIAGVYNVWMFSQSANKSIGSSFTVTSANTWQFVSLTFVGDTAAALATGNGQGIYVRWYLDVAAGSIGALNSTWSSNNGPRMVSGSVRITATLNATYQITGAQFEVGSTATSFDYRPYGTELQLCQRYYQVFYPAGQELIYNEANTASAKFWQLYLPVPMRATPTATYSSGMTGGSVIGLSGTISSLSLTSASVNRVSTRVTMSTNTGTANLIYHCDSFIGDSVGLDSEL